jgi:uncharacterized membrane protein (UPF0127 family)
VRSRPSWLAPLARSDRAPAALRCRRRGATIADRVQPAFDSRSRRQGLLRRDAFPAGEAIALAPCAAVHTWFMRFAIDIVFVSRGGEVLRVVHRVPPWRLSFAIGAHAVIELPPGSAEAAGLRRGDVLELAWTAGEGTPRR